MRYAVIDKAVPNGAVPANVVGVFDTDGDPPAVQAGQGIVCDPPAAVTAGWVFLAGQFQPAAPTAQQVLASAVDARRDAILTGGFSHDFGSPTGIKVLQTATTDDDTNWLTLQNSCLAAVTAGQGAISGAVIRTLDNVNVSLSYSDCLQVMLAMSAWGAAVYAASWKLKDAISAASDPASLAAIDITAGWPTNP